MTSLDDFMRRVHDQSETCHACMTYVLLVNNNLAAGCAWQVWNFGNRFENSHVFMVGDHLIIRARSNIIYILTIFFCIFWTVWPTIIYCSSLAHLKQEFVPFFQESLKRSPLGCVVGQNCIQANSRLKKIVNNSTYHL